MKNLGFTDGSMLDLKVLISSVTSTPFSSLHAMSPVGKMLWWVGADGL